jgi:hypothetical protein
MLACYSLLRSVKDKQMCVDGSENPFQPANQPTLTRRGQGLRRVRNFCSRSSFPASTRDDSDAASGLSSAVLLGEGVSAQQHGCSATQHARAGCRAQPCWATRACQHNNTDAAPHSIMQERVEHNTANAAAITTTSWRAGCPARPVLCGCQQQKRSRPTEHVMTTRP